MERTLSPNLKHKSSILKELEEPPKEYAKPVELDQRWSEIIVEGNNIPGRSYHAMSLQNGSIIIYGGFDGQKGIHEDFYYMKLADSNKFEWKPVSVSSQNKVKPGKRRRHSTVVYDDKLFLYGGQKDTVYNNDDFFQFDFKARVWSKIQAKNSPPPLDSYGAILKDSTLYLLCGFEGGKFSNYSNAVYSINLDSKEEWSTLYQNNNKSGIDCPEPRSGAAFALHGNAVYMFGGSTYDGKFNDIWKFCLSSNSWSKIEAKGDFIPEVRNGHSMVEYKSQLFIFGGIQDVTKEKNDIFSFDLQSQQWGQVHFEKPIEFIPPQRKQKNLSPSHHHHHHHRPTESPTRRKINTRSPTIKVDSPQKKQQLNFEQFNQFNYSTEENKATTFVDQKKQQQLAYQKYLMLKELEYTPDNEEKDEPMSPHSEQMKKSINLIGDSRAKKLTEIQNKHNATSNLTILKSNDQHNQTLEEINATLFKPPKQFIMGDNQLIGKKPCGRDGQCICSLGDGKILIYGGDRHLMAFNDIYFFNLEGTISPV